MYLIFDTETTGLPKKFDAPITDIDNWPRCVQIAWQLHDKWGTLIEHDSFLIKPDGFNIPYSVQQIHNISTDLAIKKGISLQEVLNKFNSVLSKTKFVVGHNIQFDLNIVGCELFRLGIENNLQKTPYLDTCTEATAEICKIKRGKGNKFKFPNLSELNYHLFGTNIEEAHNATADVETSTRCFFELIRKHIYTLDELKAEDNYLEIFNKKNPTTIRAEGLKHLNLKKESKKIQKTKESKQEKTEINVLTNSEKLKNVSFAHLHNHTEYSVLQSTTKIKDLVSATKREKMSAVALTDNENMMASFNFMKEIKNHNENAEKINCEAIEKGEQPIQTIIKPIIGCEFNVCEDHTQKSTKDNGYKMVMLAKNIKGYHNLLKMSSISFVNGFYYVPRIDKKIIEEYKENIIVLTGNTQGEISDKILNKGEIQAEEALLWWKKQFRDDLYIELMRHNQEDENHVNKVLLKLSKKHQIKTVATNNTFYIKKEDADTQDILLCIKNKEKQATPIGKGRGYRYGLGNSEYYFKSSEEMKKIFVDIPEAIINIQEIIDKIEIFTLEKDVLLPAFGIKKKFRNPKDLEDSGKRGENNYLRHITYKGAKKRYGELTEPITKRLDFELSVIEKTGYPGYFLIVEDFIRAAREMGVYVGPGRGSVGGSAVAYCLKITEIDPIKYNLLFERFLNPERMSMPDIDIDFDDEGRKKVIDYISEKYGQNKVAQIVTYGVMAAKNAIKDTARVLDFPLHKTEELTRLLPNNDVKKIKLHEIFTLNEKQLKEKLKGKEIEQIKKFKKLAYVDEKTAEVIEKAKILEGYIRTIGKNACGLIITPDDITNFVPVMNAKDSNICVTQFDNDAVESAGLLKMDLLGLKTLTIIKYALKIIKAKYGKVLETKDFPLDDAKTYELFKKREITGIFQYESDGMQKYMEELKPTVFEDLVAMNALYRPGPMEYITSFINRKHGREKIEYDIEEMKEVLEESYGITVYQEQVMLLSQKLADFTKGEADILRKAIGKKQSDILAKMKPKFIKQASKKGYKKEILDKIWNDWKAFAGYAFNKSHSACYALIGYQTAYLKANYTVEYMASVLSNNIENIKKIVFFMEECKRMGISVMGPDINESYLNFSVNEKGNIRFGIAAIKGTGIAAVKEIIRERKENGKFKSFFDVLKRVSTRLVGKRAIEGLILAGAFDSFKKTHRAQYFFKNNEKELDFLEKCLKFRSTYQENKNAAQVSLFKEKSDNIIQEPNIPVCEKWSTMETLSREKAVIGMYISAHPLDDFKNEMKFCNSKLSILDEKEKENLKKYLDRKQSVGVIVKSVEHRISKNGKGWAIFDTEDGECNYKFKIFGEEYLKYKYFLVVNSLLYIDFILKRGWIDKETGNEGDIRLKFINFMLMQDVIKNKCKSITVMLNQKEIKRENIENINKILKEFENEGKQKLLFNIRDEKEKIELKMQSREIKVNVSESLLERLEKENIRFKIN